MINHYNNVFKGTIGKSLSLFFFSFSHILTQPRPWHTHWSYWLITVISHYPPKIVGNISSLTPLSHKVSLLTVVHLSGDWTWASWVLADPLTTTLSCFFCTIWKADFSSSLLFYHCIMVSFYWRKEKQSQVKFFKTPSKSYN